MSYCVKCGTKIDVENDFCPECGTRVSKVSSVSRLQPDAATQHDIKMEMADDIPNNKRMPVQNTASSVLQGLQSAATELEKNHLIKEVSRTLLNPVFFVIGYVLFMIPTYILPYFGSNSSVINTLGVASGIGFNPALYVHIAALAVLVLITWLRGRLINKTWLFALPIAASLFDLLPGLSLIPMIPTVLHVVTIILGVKEDTAR
jgi:uncharacterized Zn finger protein (UPF0148 family)